MIMKSVKCTKCGHSVSEVNDKCPNCGASFVKYENTEEIISIAKEEQRKTGQRIIIGTWLIIIGLIVDAFILFMVYKHCDVVRAFCDGLFHQEAIAVQNDRDSIAEISYIDIYIDEGDYKQAAKWYAKAVKQKNAAAQYKLGVCYEKGFSMSEHKALIWYRKAATQGFAPAQYRLGILYYYGRGIEKDKKEAQHWFEKAAKQGDTNAKKALKNLIFTETNSF